MSTCRPLYCELAACVQTSASLLLVFLFLVSGCIFNVISKFNISYQRMFSSDQVSGYMGNDASCHLRIFRHTWVLYLVVTALF